MYSKTLLVSTWVSKYSWLLSTHALSLPHAIPLKAPWIVSTPDSEYLFCLPLRVLTIQVLLYILAYEHTYVFDILGIQYCRHLPIRAGTLGVSPQGYVVSAVRSCAVLQ